ncbi:MAG: hypothetical protein ACKE51_05785 [Methylococcaceae bacterium]
MKVIATIIFGFCLISGIQVSTGNQSFFLSNVQAADCVAGNNLSESAQNYIGRCRKGGINSEFPGEMYSKTLGEIKSGSSAVHKKAWKLLNDKRFAKLI